MDHSNTGFDENLKFEDLFDLEEIQKVQDAYSDATGVASLITDIDGTPITKPSNFCRLCQIIRATEKGSVNCMKSDSVLGRQNLGGPILQPCLSGGLWDGGTSITVGGKHIANWLIGQVRDGDQDDQRLLEYADKIGADPEEYRKALDDVTVMTQERFSKVCHFLYLIANQMSELAYKNLLQKRAIREKAELQEKLNQKSKMDALGQLTGGIAHDFNNMLGGILGASQYLKSSAHELKEENLKYLDLIIDASLRAKDLTAKLLTFSRKSDRPFASLDVHQIVEETVAILERSIDKKISITFEGRAEKSVIRGNAADIENSFLNLGINSSHAMAESGGRLIFTTSNVILDQNFIERNQYKLVPGEYIRVSVKDTGFGISRENLKKVFEPFFTTKPQREGTGLGLSTVYGVIENHGGEVSIYSEEDFGTEVYIYLPLAQGVSRSVKREHEGVSRRGSGRIYLVDDEEMILSVVSAILRKLGYEVITFQNPLEAIEQFKNEYNNIDLVITDMIMPEASGVDVFYRMREIDSGCRIILASGFSQNKELNRILDDGLSGYISKPYSDVELSRLIRDVLA